MQRLVVVPGISYGLFDVLCRVDSVTVTCRCCREQVSYQVVAGQMEYKPLAHEDECPALAFIRAAEAGEEEQAGHWLERAKMLAEADGAEVNH